MIARSNLPCQIWDLCLRTLNKTANMLSWQLPAKGEIHSLGSLLGMEKKAHRVYTGCRCRGADLVMCCRPRIGEQGNLFFPSPWEDSDLYATISFFFLASKNVGEGQDNDELIKHGPVYLPDKSFHGVEGCMLSRLEYWWGRCNSSIATKHRWLRCARWVL